MAVPFLTSIRRFTDMTILLQTRHPLNVIGSLLGTRFFDPGTNHVYRRFVARNMQLSGDPILDAASYWIQWNARAASVSHFTYQIEQIEEAWPTVLGLVASTADLHTPTVSQQVSQQTNHRLSTDVAIEDIPIAIRGRLRESASRFGYTC
jgi:hypothetical protein